MHILPETTFSTQDSQFIPHGEQLQVVKSLNVLIEQVDVHIERLESATILVVIQLGQEALHY